MNNVYETFKIQTPNKESMLDITNTVKSFVKKHQVKNGHLTIFVPHTTAAVTINENADPDVQTDMIFGLQNVFPNLKAFQHLEGNSDAHLKSSTFGVDQSIIIQDGALVLGTWQGIYFCEFDGPRQRNYHIQILF